MKGFIEVEVVIGWNEKYATRKYILNIDNISSISNDYKRIQLIKPIQIEYDVTYDTYINHKDGKLNYDRYCLETVETYEEIKKKIEEGQK